MQMKKAIVLLLLCAVAMRALADAGIPLRRFALVTGSNDGGENLVRLKYAESDARSFAAVMQDLGGVKAQDIVLVSTPTLARFQDALRKIGLMIAAPHETGERRELILYYSGHSDDDGLIMGNERFGWQELRAELNDIPADVKVAIIDSCSSGAMTRAKGGVARPAFLFDASDTTGHAYLTSASAEEAAQESDRIGSSFFTHYLISGLRGAADAAGDGVVTINEAYTYAYNETLASTERTEYGPQHPAYDFNLTGSGDLVLTDLRSASAVLTVSPDIAGRLYLRDSEGVLAVELNKTGGQSVDLGLAPGAYSAVLDAKGSRMAADVRVTSRSRATLALANMHAVTTDKTTPRGGTEAEPFLQTDGAEPAAPAAVQTPAVASTEAAAAIGAAVGSVVGGALGKAVGQAVNAAIVAAAAVAAAMPEPAAKQPAVAPAARHGAEEREGGAAPEEKAAREDLPAGGGFPPPGFSFTLLPDFSHGIFTSEEDRVISINLTIGSTRSVHGFETGLLANIESGDMVGFQSAGFVNVVQGSLSGFEIAGCVNYLGGEARFAQVAGFVNMSTGVAGGQVAGLVNLSFESVIGAQVGGLLNFASTETRGAQVAGLANMSGTDVTGAQVGGFFNWASGDVTGAQVGGLFNWTGNGLDGAQVAGFANLSPAGVSGAQVGGLFNWTGKGLDGVQVAGFVNLAPQEVKGGQVAGFFNLAGNIVGPQFSVVNIAGSVTGAQVGVINIADHVSGTQVGVINFSREIDGIPVGLLSIEARGRHDLEMWMDMGGTAYAAFALGTKRQYTLFSAGWTPGTEPAAWSIGLGIGGRSSLAPFFLDYDLSLVNQHYGTELGTTLGYTYPRLRILGGLTLFGDISIDAGLALDVLLPYLSSELDGADPTRPVYKPSFIIGVQL
jgi:hypothetical protein